MGMGDYLRSAVVNWLFGSEQISDGQRKMIEHYGQLRDYQRGRHRQQIKPRVGQADDNLAANFTGLVIERSISMLFGNGIEFDLPGETETPQELYVKAVWQANKQGILLHRAGQLGATYGTAYLKVIPDRLASPLGGQRVPQLVALNPRWMEIVTRPDDMDEAVGYVQRYVVGTGDAAVAHRITTARNNAVAVDERGQLTETGEYADAWTETHEINSRATGGRWEQVSVDDWPYPFAPIVHWQNLPDAEMPYGLSDIEDVIALQDRWNFVSANVSKIIRYHAHPKTWGVGALAGQKVSWGADEIVWLSAASQGQSQPHVENLEMQTDLESSRSFAADLRQALFDVSRTVDMSSMADKVGALTNFGLRVLFMDALHKNRTKRELYGAGLLEVNRRLLLVAGVPEAQADPGEIVWPDELPASEIEQTQALKSDVELGLVSKQTAAGERGYDWETEMERMQGEQAAGDNVGAAILRAFGQGQQGQL